MRFTLSLVNSRNGFSLVEIAIVILIAAVLGLFGTSLFMSLNRQIGSVSLGMDRTLLQNQIGTVFKKPTSCRLNLMTNTISLGATPDLDFNSIKDYNESGTEVGTIIPGLGLPIYPNSRLSVNAIRLTGPTGIGAPTLVKTETTALMYIGSLRITFLAVPGEVQPKPIVIPSLMVKTNIAGDSQSCALEKVVNVVDTCETVLGLTKDIVTGACLPTDASAQRGLCQSLGGTQPAVGLPWYCRLPTSVQNFNCPTAGDVVTGFNLGIPVCQTPVALGVWSAWGSCTLGTKTRTCLIGNCEGAASQTCP